MGAMEGRVKGGKEGKGGNRCSPSSQGTNARAPCVIVILFILIGLHWSEIMFKRWRSLFVWDRKHLVVCGVNVEVSGVERSWLGPMNQIE